MSFIASAAPRETQKAPLNENYIIDELVFIKDIYECTSPKHKALRANR